MTTGLDSVVAGVDSVVAGLDSVVVIVELLPLAGGSSLAGVTSLKLDSALFFGELVLSSEPSLLVELLSLGSSVFG